MSTTSLGVVRSYLRFAVLLKDVFNVNLPGRGRILRLIRDDHVIVVGGRPMFLDHRVASCYERLVAGAYNEPETHRFLNRVLAAGPPHVGFIDVGANIGEMVLDAMGRPQVDWIVAFEPTPACASACRRTAELNAYSKLRMVEKAAAAEVGVVRFGIDQTNASASAIVSDTPVLSDRARYVEVAATTLDAEIGVPAEPCILLIDVEGAEVQVMRGARALIAGNRPLIIFEFNEVSRRSFTLSDVASELGAQYELYRLRRDGRLDRNFSSTWNCVAVARTGAFHDPATRLVVAGERRTRDTDRSRARSAQRGASRFQKRARSAWNSA